MTRPASNSAARKIGGPSEREFQRSVTNYAELRGYMVAHFHDSRRQVAPGRWIGDRDAAGIPDLLIVGHGRTLFRELKRDGGRLSPKQRAWIAWLEQNGADVAVWTPQDWPLIERTLL